MNIHRRKAWALIAVVCGVPGATAAQEPATASPSSPSDATTKDESVDDRWTSYVGLGAQFLPDYDENGRGSGLNKQELFALVTADGRFGDDCVATFDRKSAGQPSAPSPLPRFKYCMNPLIGPWHTGVALTLLGTPVKREDKPAISPTEFNDVARTAVFSGYLYFPMIQSNDNVDNFGPFVRGAGISRENLDENMDSVTWVYGLGIQYTSETFRVEPDPAPPAPRKNHFNAAPRGFVRLYAARYEDYAGFGRSTRFITDAAFRVSKGLDLYFGFQGNFGDGPDEMAVVVSFVRTPDEIASLFMLGKE